MFQGPFLLSIFFGCMHRARFNEPLFDLILGEPGIRADQGGVSASGTAKPPVDEAITTILRLPRGSDAFPPCCCAIVACDADLPGRGGPPSPQEDRLVLAQAEPWPAGPAGPSPPAQRERLLPGWRPGSAPSPRNRRMKNAQCRRRRTRGTRSGPRRGSRRPPAPPSAVRSAPRTTAEFSASSATGAAPVQRTSGGEP